MCCVGVKSASCYGSECFFFCVVCSLAMLVSEAMGDQTVFAYSMIGRVIVLYVVVRVSLLLPQYVVVSALSRLIVFVAFVFVFCMCVEYVSFGSSVRPSILGLVFVGSVSLFICSVKVVLYCAGSGVKSVVVVLDVFSVSWFCCVQSCICCRYGCTCDCAVVIFVCVERTVTSSAYEMVFMFMLGGGEGRSAIYMLKIYVEHHIYIC